MIALSSTGAMLAAMRSARSIVFCSYFLPSARVEAALEDAARRGAAVHVRLEARLYRGTEAMDALNRRAVARLRSLGADAALVDRGSADAPGLHMKAAVLDGTAYLDTCNWNRGDAVLRDDAPRDAAAIRSAALHGRGAGTRDLALHKAAALELERAVLLRSRPAAVEVESESLRSSPISAALRQLAARGVRCRVLVAARQVRALRPFIASLEQSGVQVRAAAVSEKFAVAGPAGWIGSADATSPYYNGDCIDWGMRIRAKPLVEELHARFDARWRAARPV